MKTEGTPWRRPANLAAFGAAIRRRREACGKTLDGVAAETRISKPYLAHIETARAPGPPSAEKLRRLAKALAIPAEELLAGADWLRTPASVRKLISREEAHSTPALVPEHVGDSRTPLPRRADGTINLDALIAGAHPRQQESLKQRQGIAGELGLKSIPLINRVAAGGATEHSDLDYPVGIADGYVPAPDLPEAPDAGAFALRVQGDSMMPEYREGELIIVGPPGEQGVRDGDDCVVRLGEEEQFATTFKRVFFEMSDGEHMVRLVPLNPTHAERRVKASDVTGIYPLLWRLIPARK